MTPPTPTRQPSMGKGAFLALLFTIACAGNYTKKIRATEESFFSGDIDSAVQQITPLAQDSVARDRLLFYMEAGVIYHSKGDLKTSNEIFLRANEMADEIKTSITDGAKSFLLSDREAAFQGENFERILIKYYLALNYTLLGELENAKRMLRKLDADLKDMKYEDSAYKQILAARYLDALISEELKEWNDARVQYKNLENFGVDSAWLGAERKLLDNRPKEKGELVILVQSGKAAAKVSRGSLMNDREFALALRIAIDVAILTNGKGLSTAGVIAMLGTAENPIARFDVRESGYFPTMQLSSNPLPAGVMLTDFDAIANKNFNENYSSYINKNVASIATKIVIAAVAADAIAQSIRKNNDGIAGALGGLAVGLAAGGGVAATVKADLRSWRMLPAGFAALRVVVPPGTYDLKLAGDSAGLVQYGPQTVPVEIKAGKKTFVSLRVLKRGG